MASASNNGAARGSPSTSAASAAGGPQSSKMQQLLSMARERLREQQLELASRESTIRELQQELEEARSLAGAAGSGGVTFRAGAVASGSGAPARAWCQVDERSLGLESMHRWVLFELEDEGLEWRRFPDVASLEDHVRRDPGSEPLRVPEPALTEAEAREIREQAEHTVAQIRDDFRKFRVSAELARKQREALDREAAARRTLLRDAPPVAPSTERRRTDDGAPGSDPDDGAPVGLSEEEDDDDARGALEDRCARLEAENEGLKKQLLKRRSAFAGSVATLDGQLGQSQVSAKTFDGDPASPGKKQPSSPAADAALAAQWRQRYENVVKDRDRLETTVRSLTTSGPQSTEYADLARDYEALQAEFKRYKADALKAMRLQEQDLRRQQQQHQQQQSQLPSPNRSQTAGALEALGARRALAVKVPSRPTSPQRNEDAAAKLQYLKNLMSKYLATAQPQSREHMERAILMVLNFSDDEKAAIANKQAAGSASGSASSKWW